MESTTSSKTGYFFSTGKAVIILLGFLPSIIWIPICASISVGRITGLIIGIITFLIFYFYFLRFVIFEELTWKKIFKNLRENKISNTNYFWDIDKIDRDGTINYVYTGSGGTRKAFIIKLIAESKIGKGENYTQEYRNNIRIIMRNLLRDGYEFSVYETREPRSVPDNLKNFYNNLKRIEDPFSREIALEHINNLAKITRNRKRLESLHIVVYITDVKKFRSLSSEKNKILNLCSRGKYFKDVKILKEVEPYEFISKILCINTIHKDNKQSQIEEFKKYGQIYRVFDTYGNEEWIDFGNIEDIVEVEREYEEDFIEKTDEMRREFNRSIEEELISGYNEEREENIDFEDLIKRGEKEINDGELGEDKRRILIKELVLRRNLEEINEKSDETTDKIKKLEQLRKNLVRNSTEKDEI